MMMVMAMIVVVIAMRMRTVITSEARLTTYGAAQTRELYDLAADPLESENLAGILDGAALEASMLGVLAENLTAVADTGVRPSASA